MIETLRDDRRPVRRRALRHGDAGPQRRLRSAPGAIAPGRRRRPSSGPTVIPAVQGRASRIPVHRRGVLGPGVGAAAAGLRLLLRQAALRPARARTRPSRCALHLLADLDYQHRLVRFLENHDEPRAAATLSAREGAGRRGRRRSRRPARRSSTTASSTVAQVQLPVFLGRRPVEPPDDDAAARSTAAARAATRELREATGSCCERSGWPDNDALPTSSRGAGATATPAPGRRQPVRCSGAGARPLPWEDVAGRGLAADRRC